MRVVRVLLGVVAILLAIPLMGGGAALWLAGQHRTAGGWFATSLDQVGTRGYAIVVPDVDALLRRDAPVVRGTATGLRITAQVGAAATFVGLAPRPAVQRYLDGVPYVSIDRVRLALGRLPVTARQVGGSRQPATAPAEQPFWVVASGRGTVEWSPGSVRGQELALVVMRFDGSAGVDARLAVGVRPGWLGAVSWALLVVGVAGLAAGLALVLWPVRPREIVYVASPPLPATPQPPPVPASRSPGWMLETAEIIDVSSLVAASTAPITPDFVWPPLAPDAAARAER
jgi:hypothetical protein